MLQLLHVSDLRSTVKCLLNYGAIEYNELSIIFSASEITILKFFVKVSGAIFVATNSQQVSSGTLTSVAI